MTASHGGKGDKPRPMSVDSRTFSDNFDAIFRKEKRPGSDRRVDQSKKRGEKK